MKVVIQNIVLEAILNSLEGLKQPNTSIRPPMIICDMIQQEEDLIHAQECEGFDMDDKVDPNDLSYMKNQDDMTQGLHTITLQAFEGHILIGMIKKFKININIQVLNIILILIACLSMKK